MFKGIYYLFYFHAPIMFLIKELALPDGISHLTDANLLPTDKPFRLQS